MTKVPNIPDKIHIDWEAIQKSLNEGEWDQGPPIEVAVKIDLDKIDKECEDAMKCVALVPDKSKRRKPWKI